MNESPSIYYCQLCEAFDVEVNDHLLQELEKFDEALEILSDFGIKPLEKEFTALQLLDVANSQSLPETVRWAAKTCINIELGEWFTDEDINVAGATVRATLPFVCILTMKNCRKVTDEGFKLLGGYIFSSKDEEDMDDTSPQIMHLDLRSCPNITPATTDYLLDVLRAGSSSNTLTSVLLSRFAMDGNFDTLQEALTRRTKEVNQDILKKLKERIKELDNKASQETDDEVSFHQMEITEAALGQQQTSPVRTVRTLHNNQHDEVWYPEEGASEISSPNSSYYECEEGAIPTNTHRTVIGDAKLPSADILEVLGMIEMYQPKAMDLPMKFMFPGPLSYFPVVQSPDPILSPAPPRPITKIKIGVDEGESSASLHPSMFTSFFRTAHESNSPRTPRGLQTGPAAAPLIPRPPLTARPPTTANEEGLVRNNFVRRQSSSASNAVAQPPEDNRFPTLLSPLSNPIPRVPPINLSSIKREGDPLVYYLSQVNDALLNTKAAMVSRPLQLPKVSDAFVEKTGGLAAALNDPSWNPYIPSRIDLVEHSLSKKKLNYNVIKMERKKEIPTWMSTRDYKAELLIKPTKAETLSSGSMNDAGTLLATTHYDMNCRVWKAESGELVHTLQGHANHLSDCVWNSPFCTKIITSSFDKTLKVWDVRTGSEIHTLVGHELEVVCVSVSPNGLLCASGGMDDIAIIWDIELGIEKYNLLGHEGEVIALDFSPCGEKLVTGSMDETVRVWSVGNGSQLHKFEGHTSEVNQVKFNCFGNLIISGSIDTTCRLWDVATGQNKVLRGHTHEVVDCDFSPDGWTCASASDDNTLRIWDVLTGGCTMLLVGHTQGVCRLLFTPDGKSIVSGSLDSTARVWNTSNGECKQILNGHKGLVIASYNAASDRIITMSRDNTCRLWRLEDPHNTLAGMAALAIGRSVTTYQQIVEQKLVPRNLQTLLTNFFEKVQLVECEKTLKALSEKKKGNETVQQTSLPAGAEGEDDEVGEESVTRVVDLRGRSRLVDISPLDEIRVE